MCACCSPGIPVATHRSGGPKGVWRASSLGGGLWAWHGPGPVGPRGTAPSASLSSVAGPVVGRHLSLPMGNGPVVRVRPLREGTRGTLVAR
ncbi:hypothetical protein BQ8420_15220 [Nocardiopsis sp. JB363]|nr:hypothetical protein BQ8420_15220 [Nocardiopsis sp. JB363]